MTIEDIVKAEADNNNTIILLREGIFWKAYEKSAYAFCKHIKPFMVKKKFIKSVNDEIVSIGFPMSSTQVILEGRPILLEEEKKMVVSIDDIDNDEFIAWKNEQALTVVPQNTSRGVRYSSSQELQNCSNQEKEVITRIKMFSLESKTPLECMLFLSELKKRLS